MNRAQYLFFVIAITMTGCADGSGQSLHDVETAGPVTETKADNDPERQSRIRENLEYQLRNQLQGQSISVGAMEQADVDGFDEGTVVIGQQTLRFLTTHDDTHFYLVAAGPFDASLSSEEIAEARIEDERLAALELRERNESLNTAIRNLPVRGNEDAPVTLVEFSDFQCPFCRQGFDVVEQVLKKYPKEVRFAYMHFPLDIHPWAMPAAVIAVCTAQQDPEAFWTLHDAYFKNQDEITPENIFEQSRAYLAGGNLDMDVWSECAEDTGSAAHESAVTAVLSSIGMGEQFGITGTPGFFINGSFIRGVPPMEMIEDIIDQALQETK